MTIDTVLVESAGNDVGLEVRAREVTTAAVSALRAYRCGELVAMRLVDRRGGAAIGGGIVYERHLGSAARELVRGAMEEALRVLRDGRGLT